MKIRGGGRTGAAGAFAPVNFWQRVHCTRPEGHLQSEGQKNPRKFGCAYLIDSNFDNFLKRIVKGES